jgi:spermidine synthase
MELSKKHQLYIFLLFFEGLVGTSYQVLYIRQFSSTVGMSAEISGIIISIFLGAMSLGYRVGAKSQSDPIHTLGKNFLIVSIIGGITATPSVIDYYLGSDMISNTYWRVAIYSLVSVGGVAFFIAQSLPLLMKFKKWGEDASEQGGNALFVSTLGSMAGAVLPITILAAYIGANNTLLVVGASAAIVGAALYCQKKLQKRQILFLVLSISCLSPITTYLIAEQQNTPFTSTAYNDIYFKRSGDLEIMEANKAYMSVRYISGGSASGYVHFIQQQMKNLGIKDKDILILGAGGFQLHDKDDTNRYVYVDIDGELLEWASKYFSVEKDHVNMIVSDARKFLIEDPREWDVIIMDTFSSSQTIPEHLVTKEFFELARDRLRNIDSLFIANIIASGGFRDKYSQRMYNTIHQAMPFCQTHQVLAAPAEMSNNIVYTCFTVPNEYGVYTDNLRRPNVDITGGD